YRWNEDQSDATLVGAEGGQTRLSIVDPEAPHARREQIWTFAGRAQCSRCHNAGAGYTLAFNLAQLDRPIGLDDSGPGQLQVLEKRAVIQFGTASSGPAALPQSHAVPQLTRRLADPYNDRYDLDQRFRSYL